ncbi:MAG: branched-chain amino acid ABC transporter permease [Deltaproteobacteria bacterium CG_4_9_14_3_um_filter_65_9]|nr:MAG: branched-chain amino acid ABC transporter permease [Deltaproteobacteria bacterium CG_4_9_14_3_um_filter_65_9]
MEFFFQYLVAGITYGTIYAIVAIGFNIIYNATGIINFAQGEFVMLGGMTAVTLNQFLPMPLAILLAVVLTTIVGALIEIVFIRWLYKPSVLRMVIITIGVSILIREIALHVWGEGVKALPYFTGSSISSINLGGVYVSSQVLWVVGVGALAVAALTAFFNLTMLGRQMRACAANRDAARLCGIDAGNMVTLSFMISAAIGAIGGAVVCPITYVQYDSGTPLAIKGFTVAILGGLGNSTGAVGAGMILGILESFSIWVLPTAYKEAISIAILLAILFVKPSGIFGSAEAARLKEF